MRHIRSPQVAGYFYPANAEKLKNEIKFALDISKPQDRPEKVFGIVAPHAGYTYSGKTAAYAYNLIAGKSYKRAVVISPSHAEYFPGICVYKGDAYETPLGLLEIDKDFVEILVNKSGIIFKGIDGHGREHALEVQLPFLQTVLENFKIVPIVMGDQRKVYVDALAKRLSEIIDDETLIVASSDMSHFHSKSEADILDSIVERRINNFDYEGLQKDLDYNNCEACGGGPIVVLMKTAALKNITHSIVLNRSDSGDVTGDYSGVVGYLSAVVYGE